MRHLWATLEHIPPTSFARERVAPNAMARVTRMVVMIPLAIYAARSSLRPSKSLLMYRYCWDEEVDYISIRTTMHWRLHTSAMVKMALKVTPTIKTTSIERCTLGKRLVSNTDNRMRPSPPIAEPSTARLARWRSLLRIWGMRLNAKNKEYTKG